MDSLLLLLNKHYDIQTLYGDFKHHINLGKLNPQILRGICDPSKLSNERLRGICDLQKLSNEELHDICDISKLHISHIFTEMSYLEKGKKVFDKLLSIEKSFTLDELNDINFTIMGSELKQYCLNRMILNNFPIDKLTVLLNMMKSVNYGTETWPYADISLYNPLITSCQKNRLDLVKILIEKYSADVNYTLRASDSTAIMYCNDNIDIIKYLYDKGANLATNHKHVNNYIKLETINLIQKWASEKNGQFVSKQENTNSQSKSDQVKYIEQSDQSRLVLLLNKLNNEMYPDKLLKTILSTQIFPETKSYSLELMKSIEFEKFSDFIQQSFLNNMIRDNLSTEIICILLDKMESVNYGNTSYGVNSTLDQDTINPLVYCCQSDRMDLVQLLVEKYNANIDYLVDDNQSAIMVIADGTHKNFIKITEYLYKKGASLYKYNAGRDVIEQFRYNLESNKDKKQLDILKEKYEKLQSDFDNLKSMFDINNCN